jgi:hypothetical protein
MSKTTRNFLIGAVLCLGVGSCITPQEVQDARDAAVEQRTALDERIDRLEQLQIDASVAGNEEFAVAYGEQIEITEGMIEKIDTTLTKVGYLFDEDGNLKQPEEIVDRFSPLLPAEIAVWITLVLGIVKSISKMQEWKGATTDLVQALDSEKKDSNGLAEAMHKSGASFRSRLSSDTKRKVVRIRNGNA